MENKNKIIDELNNIIYELKNKLYDTKSNNKILINNINYYKKINDILCEENEELKAEIHNMKYPIDELVDVVEESHNKEKQESIREESLYQTGSRRESLSIPGFR